MDKQTLKALEEITKILGTLTIHMEQGATQEQKARGRRDYNRLLRLMGEIRKNN